MKRMDYRQARWRARNPNKQLAQELRLYGVTLEWHRAQEAKQRNLCAICGQPETVKRNGVVRRLCVDHNHITGAVRGLLCTTCNTRLGLYESQWRERMAAYLAQYPD